MKVERTREREREREREKTKTKSVRGELQRSDICLRWVATTMGTHRNLTTTRSNKLFCNNAVYLAKVSSLVQG